MAQCQIGAKPLTVLTDAKVPRVTIVTISLHIQAKDRSPSARFHKHKIELKYVYIWLKILFSTHLSVKSIQMDIFP